MQQSPATLPRARPASCTVAPIPIHTREKRSRRLSYSELEFMDPEAALALLRVEIEAQEPFTSSLRESVKSMEARAREGESPANDSAFDRVEAFIRAGGRTEWDSGLDLCEAYWGSKSRTDRESTVNGSEI